MDPLACTEEKYTAKDAVYCPDCTRNYTIIGIRHICNQFLRCPNPRTKYLEEYISTEATVADIAKCNHCELKIQRANAYIKAICKCGYEGRYKMRPDKLCPVCAAIADAPCVPTTQLVPLIVDIDHVPNFTGPEIKAEKIVKATVVLIMDSQLKPLNCANGGDIFADFRLEFMTDESMSTDTWAIQSFEFTGSGPVDMSNISDWMKSNNYWYHWINRDSMQFLRFRRMYNEYAGDDRYPI